MSRFVAKYEVEEIPGTSSGRYFRVKANPELLVKYQSKYGTILCLHHACRSVDSCHHAASVAHFLALATDDSMAHAAAEVPARAPITLPATLRTFDDLYVESPAENSAGRPLEGVLTKSPRRKGA